MTKLTNVLKTMETETTGVKNDVINFLLDNNDNSEDLQSHLEDINNYGCESAQVNHLIYYTDTVKYFEEHKSEIMEMLESFGIEYVESQNGIEQLAEMFPKLDTVEDRHEEAEEKIREYAEEEVSEYYGDDWDNMDDEEKETAIQGYAYNVADYEINPMELNDLDKNYLAWAIFEHEAVNLENELSDLLNK